MSLNSSSSNISLSAQCEAQFVYILNRSLSEDTILPAHDRFSLFCVALMITLCVIGVLCNILSIFAFTRRKMRCSSINLLLAALSFVDLVLLVLTVPTLTLPPIYLWHPVRALIILSNYCTVYLMPFCYMAQTASVWLFLVISFERYIAVCHPLMVQVHCTVGSAKLAITVVVIAAFLFNLIRFWEFELAEYKMCPVTGVLVNNQCYRLLMYLITQVVGPLMAICGLNYRVVATMSRARALQMKMSTNQQSEHRTAKMMIIVIVIFLSCYLLSAILAILDAFIPMFYDAYYPWPQVLTDISNTLIILNSTCTALVYFTFSKNYRTICISLFLIWCPCAVRLLSIDFLERFIADRTTCTLGYADSVYRRTIRLNNGTIVTNRSTISHHHHLHGPANNTINNGIYASSSRMERDGLLAKQKQSTRMSSSSMVNRSQKNNGCTLQMSHTNGFALRKLEETHLVKGNSCVGPDVSKMESKNEANKKLLNGTPLNVEKAEMRRVFFLDSRSNTID